MRSDFEKWCLENEHDQYALGFEDAYMAGCLSQQSKVDELQKRVDAALKLIESWSKVNFDKTTHWTEGYEEGCYHCAASIEQALKGGCDEAK